ncbi:hemerythrin domain-containing protein [Nonomuraea sp. NN258]|uniref:hemerythrin domain-containing protein n=1 Tax=Nonomuraea antri TaxID=2730852 RepID=UPI0015680EA3|nr:hemerythrin domain-containing protein [Nonomuraea antri]NRQ32656.1 hemerythrin domain-containing protein [Nonomuraea antri]
MTTENKPAVWEMVVVHRAFRREFKLAPELVRQVAPGDLDRTGTLVSYLTELLDGLQIHHSGGDKLLWPLLRSRVTFEVELADSMERRRESVHAHLTRLRELLPAWAASAGAGERDLVADALLRLHDDLVEHLDQEEARVLPLVAEFVTKDEWDTLSEHASGRLPKDRRLIHLGSVLEDATEGERERFLALLPLPARLAWHVRGRRQYRRERADVRRGFRRERAGLRGR